MGKGLSSHTHIRLRGYRRLCLPHPNALDYDPGQADANDDNDDPCCIAQTKGPISPILRAEAANSWEASGLVLESVHQDRQSL